VALITTDVSEERIGSIIVMTRIAMVGMLAVRSLLRLLVTPNVVPSSPILVTLMMETVHYTETSVFRRAKRRNIPEDRVLQTRRKSHLCAVRNFIEKPLGIMMNRTGQHRAIKHFISMASTRPEPPRMTGAHSILDLKRAVLIVVMLSAPQHKPSI
jgi:hypothetical protein